MPRHGPNSGDCRHGMTAFSLTQARPVPIFSQQYRDLKMTPRTKHEQLTSSGTLDPRLLLLHQPPHPFFVFSNHAQI
ncbi:hypothetical protein E2562_035692 [Oryza meyeriana var. granulata]|uniref:Uncharacterized protein n=1 Tax=Oryza meyeriana var. granulata TaxID=110450 RepID=A0A6G1CYN1_9ORYZ|nr:hypothetical protein E2562_035692 [Oryza meyeriana var. granulata]